MTTRELRILFFKDTGLYPPVDRIKDKDKIIPGRFASEFEYIRWLENKFIDYFNSDMSSILQGRDLIKAVSKHSLKSNNRFKNKDEE